MYATRDDLVANFTELAISELESMHIDPSIATTKALKQASGKMDSYLSMRYNVPMEKTDNLVLVCCNIARYLLYVNDATGEPEDRYIDEIKWLKDVGAKKANVTFDDTITEDEKASTYIKPAVPIGDSYRGQVFGDDVFDMMPGIK